MAMFKILAFLCRRPGMTPEAFRAHYETTHLPLARATFPEIVGHRRNYATDGGHHFPPGVAVPAWDAVSEIWFADRTGFDAMLARIASGGAPAITEDELRFLDRERCGMMIVDETALQGIPA
jgi:uncharacterized protein (TIGR02118 family)